MADSMQTMTEEILQDNQFGHKIATSHTANDSSIPAHSSKDTTGDNVNHTAGENIASTNETFRWFNPNSARQAWQKRWKEAPNSWRDFMSSYPKKFGMTNIEEEKIRVKNETYVETPALTDKARVGSSLIMGFVGSVSKILMKHLNSLYLYNIQVLHDAIERRHESQGLLTFSNHRSVMDDPFLLGSMLPARILFNPYRMRWGLCSLDICFQNALIGRSLRLGKALPLKRRGGISQSFLATAAEKLASGDWVHIYPEGRVRQFGMGYSKRGVGKLLAMAYEARQRLPLILPMYHEGIENVMPQNKQTNQLQSSIPQVGKNIFVITGEAVDIEHIFEKFMPACLEAGGTKHDAAPCVKLYEEVADFLAITMRLLRAELRQRVRKEHNVDLGEPYEFS